MTFRLTLIALVFMLAPVALSQTRGKKAFPSDQIKAQVLNAYQEINEASVRGDVEELDRLMSDDFVGIGTHVEVIADKRSLLSLMKTGRIKLTYHKDRMLRVMIGSAMAVITGESTTRGRRDGQAFNMRYQFSDVFERRGGQWQNVLSRLTKIIPN